MATIDGVKHRPIHLLGSVRGIGLLVFIHLLTINARQGFFNPKWRIPEKVPLGTMGGGKGWGKLQIALTCVCMPCLGHMKGLHYLP